MSHPLAQSLPSLSQVSTWRDVIVETVGGSKTDRPEAHFHWPLGIALTPQGDLLVANYLGHSIKLIDKNGAISTYAGTGQQGSQDDHKEKATFSGPSSIVVTLQGDILVTDALNNCVRMVDRQGEVTVFAGTGQQGCKNGPKQNATFCYPFGIFRSPQGQLYIVDKGNHSIRMIGVDGTVSTFAGSGQSGCKDGPKEQSMFNTPYGLCLVPDSPNFRTSGPHLRSSSQQMFIADSGNHRICFVNELGICSTFAGAAGQVGCVDGPNDVAKFNGPRSVILTPHGDLIVSDQGNQRIRIVETNGLVSTFAGCDKAGCVDGPRELASFSSPSNLCLTPSGDLYVSDFTNNKVRKIKCPMWDISDQQSQPKKLPHFNLQSLLQDSCPSSMSDFKLSISASPSSQAQFSQSIQLSSGMPGTHSELSTAASPHAVAYSNGFTWYLHKIVLYARCPTLLSPPVIDRIQASTVSLESVNALLFYIYNDYIPQLSLPQLFDLDYLLNICQLTSISKHIRSEIHERLNDDSSIVSLLTLLGHVSKHHQIDDVLVDVVVAKLRSNRSEVANYVELLFTELVQNNPLLMRVISKLLGDQTLSTVSNDCSYSILTGDSIDCQHFGRISTDISQLLYFANTQQADATGVESSNSKEDSSNAMAEQDIEESSMVRKKPKILQNEWLEPDFTIIVEGSELKCHRSILYGRWPYFAGAMKMGGYEWNESKLELPSDTFSPCLMRAILRYLYSDKVAGIDTDEYCLTVLKHSVLFGFVDADNEPQAGFEVLITHCRRPLTKPLTPGNCVGVLTHVLLYGNAHQQQKVRSYVARFLPDIMKNDKLAIQLEALGPAENMKILFEQYGRQTNSPLKSRPSPPQL